MPGRGAGDLSELWLQLWRWVERQLQEKLVTPAGGVGMVEEIGGTGYLVEEERMANVEKLRALGMEAVTNPAWIAHDITGDGRAETFCNRSARFIAEGMGYFGIPRDIYANGMIAHLATAPGWREDSIERAWACAMKGGLAFIAIEDEPNGHLAAVAPEPKELSGSWGIEVPKVYNVGRTNGLMKLSQAFKVSQLPALRAFVWEESIA